MKKIFFITCGIAIALAGIAQQDSTFKKKPIHMPNEKYCTTMKNGKIIVTLNDRQLKNDIDLKNGTKITASGTVVRKDGTIQMLKPGTCVNTEGNEIEEAEEKKQ